jgi:hypothetical protein
MASAPLVSLLPRVEDPIPDTIGVGFIFSMAGAGGVVMLVFGSMLGMSAAELDAWARRGVSIGFMAGAFLYAAALVEQIL